MKYSTPLVLDDWYGTVLKKLCGIDTSNLNSHSSQFIGIFDNKNLNSTNFQFNDTKLHYYVLFNKDHSVHTSVASFSRSCGSGNVLLLSE